MPGVTVLIDVHENTVMSDADAAEFARKIGRRLRGDGDGAAGSPVPAPRKPAPLAPATAARA